MFKKSLLFILLAMLVNLAAFSSVFAETKAEKEARLTEKIKNGVTKIGTGKDALIEVKLKDKTILKGYVKETGNDSFTVANYKTGEETVVPYPSAKQIRGNNLSTGAKVAIGLGVLAAVLTILLIFENYG